MSDFQSRSIGTPPERPIRPRPPRRSFVESAVRPGPAASRVPRAWRVKANRAWEWLKRGGWKQRAAKAVGIVGGVCVLYIGFLWMTLPDLNETLFAAQSTVITDRNGTELYRLYEEEDRTYIPGTQIPESMKEAIIAIEDERFHSRGCIDFRAVARIFLRFGQAGGASTLTRQLARNALNLQQEPLLSRKLKEFILACALEAQYDREKILELYLNWIPFGQNAYGVEQASKRYFGVSAKDLTLAQSAILAALPQRPSYFSPYGSHVRTELSEEALADVRTGQVTKTSQLGDGDVTIGLLGKTFGSGSTSVYVGGRVDQVLRNMMDQGYITDAERLQALADLETIQFQSSRESIRAPHFVLWVKQQVEEMLENNAEEGIIDQGGLRIETTIDWDLQQIATQAVESRREDYGRLYGAFNTALVAADPNTGEVLAYVGNADYNDEEHNGRVDMARAARQPGSSFKPIIYAGAFTRGYGPATVLHDVPTKIGDYEPQNFDLKFWGLMNIRQALGASRNIPAIKAYFLAGEEDKLLDFAESLGAPTPKARKPGKGYGPSMAIGSAETPLTEMVQMYATFAGGGIRRPLVTIRKITDHNGNILPCAICAESGDEEPREEQVLDPRIAYEVTSILSDGSVRPGDFWRNALSVPEVQAAAKTGTSNKCLEQDAQENCTKRKPLDLWTMGYSPSLVTGVWVGNADSTALSDSADGLNVAAPIWKEFMTKAHKELEDPVTQFTMPEGIVQPLVSTLSGELPTECTPVAYRKSDLFLKENAPTKPDPACQRILVDKVTGLLASDLCPAEAAEERSFYVPYSVLSDRFPQWLQGISTWVAGRSGPGAGSGATSFLVLPPKDKCDPALTPGRLDKPTVTLEFPHDGGQVPYPSFRARLDTEVQSSVKQITFFIDGKLVLDETTPPFTNAIRVPNSVSREGSHRLRVVIFDRYYNQAEDEVTFSFGEDENGPTVRFMSPSSATRVEQGATIRIAAKADDGEGDIKHVQFFLDDTLLTTKPSSPYELEYALDVPPGNHELRAVATDAAGNVSEDEVRIAVVPKGSGSGAVETPTEF